NGLAKIGSGDAVEAGAFHHSASVGQSDMNPAPVAKAIRRDAAIAMRFRTGSTGSRIGWPLISSGKIVSSPSAGGVRAANGPRSPGRVASAKLEKTLACRLRVFQKTSPYPSEPNQSAST